MKEQGTEKSKRQKVKTSKAERGRGVEVGANHGPRVTPDESRTTRKRNGQTNPPLRKLYAANENGRMLPQLGDG